MKNFKNILVIGCALTLSLTSCSDFLDVNKAEDTPSNVSASIKNRLPWIQNFYTYSAGIANYRTACIAGVYYSTNGTVGPCTSTWNFSIDLTTTPYQSFFISTGSNLNELYEAAEKEGENE